MDIWIERFKQIRQEKNISLSQAAGKINIQETLLAMIELGEVVPAEEHVHAIMQFVIDEM